MLSMIKMKPLFALFLSVLAVASTASSDDDKLIQPLIGWLRSQGGFFSEKLEIRRADPNDAASYYGMFVKEDVEAKEKLFEIPRECIISVPGEIDLEEDEYFEQLCPLSQKLLKEMRLANDSQYGPFINYLLSQRYGQIPATYSKPGKALLRKVIGKALPPKRATTWISKKLKKTGCISKDDPFEEQAVALAAQRGWDNMLIPVLDLVNHHNGKVNTENNSARAGGNIIVQASKAIKAGEELYTTYDECIECGGTADWWGTPEIFRDFGFVEPYPQRYHFLKQDISFKIDEIVKDDGTSELDLTWWEGEQVPGEWGIHFLRDEVKRLKKVAKDEFDAAREVVPENELDAILKFHEAITVAMSTALKAAIEFEGSDTCDSKDGTCSASWDRYDSLENDMDTFYDYYVQSYQCDTLAQDLDDYVVIDTIRSHYQEIQYTLDPKSRDACFYLDGVWQMCGCYRPHYHEMMVHHTARYFDTVKRVLWVGGGDSMLLHEILKYPSLELVVGLELDQKMPRNAFKHFGVQTHFDDERVQWWFGDASKTMLMLPKEYFGSFDFIVVDLSDTVMALSVTKDLNIIGALSLLLKPDGIFDNERIAF